MLKSKLRWSPAKSPALTMVFPGQTKPIFAYPTEILLHILSYLSTAQLIQLKSLSKAFYELVQHTPEIWYHVNLQCHWKATQASAMIQFFQSAHSMIHTLEFCHVRDDVMDQILPYCKQLEGGYVQRG
jgi:hypothetical protein